MKFFTLIIVISSSFVWGISPDSNYYFDGYQNYSKKEKDAAKRLPSAENQIVDKKKDSNMDSNENHVRGVQTKKDMGQ